MPTEFVAARNEVVKAMRRAKERDEATLVAALRRPDWTDWALNAAAAARTDVVEKFASAASDVRQAQAAAIEGREGPDVRTALRSLRERTADVIREAAAAMERVGRPPGTAELTARLAEIAGSAVATDQLRMGVLGSGDPAVSDLFAGLEPPAHPRPRRAAPSKRAAVAASTKREQPTSSERTPSVADRQRIKRAEQARKISVRDLAGADADLDKAIAAVAIAREKLADGERRQADATKRRLAAAEKLAHADKALAALDATS